MVVLAVAFAKFCFEVCGDVGEDGSEPLMVFRCEHPAAIFRDEYQMHMQRRNT